MAIGRHHAHAVGPQLPEHAVQDRPALFGRRGERHVADELVHHAGRRLPGLLEFDGREGWKLFARQAQQLELERPDSIETRASPAAVTRTGPDGSSRAMSTSFLAGSVTAPSTSTSAATVVLTAMSRSVPDRRNPPACFEASTRTLASTGSVVLAGMAAATAAKPS